MMGMNEGNIGDADSQGEISLSESCELVTVSEIMIQDVITVKQDDTIEYLIELMVAKPHHSYPVLDKEGELKGIVDQDNILELLFFERIPRHHHTHLMAIRALSEEVSTLMIKHPMTIPHDMSLCEAADLMIKHHVDRICVTMDGKFAGMISKQDLIRKVFMLRGMK